MTELATVLQDSGGSRTTIQGGERWPSRHGTGLGSAAQAALLDDPEFLRGLVQGALQAILEAEMTAHLGASRYERTRGADRLPQRHQTAHAQDAGGHARAAGAPGPGRHLLDRALRPLPAHRAGAGADADGDVPAGRLDPQGGDDHRAAVRHELLQEPGLGADGRLDAELAAWRERPLRGGLPRT